MANGTVDYNYKRVIEFLSINITRTFYFVSSSREEEILSTGIIFQKYIKFKINLKPHCINELQHF